MLTGNKYTENTKCVNCDSNSTVFDLGQWVCSQHIKLDTFQSSEVGWDFRGDSTIESMDYQSPETDIPDGHGGYINHVDMPRLNQIDRKNDEKIKEWVEKNDK